MSEKGTPEGDVRSERFQLGNGILAVHTSLYPYLLREFDAACQRLLRFPNKVLYVDLTGCKFFSTVVLSSLIKTHLAAQRQSRKLVLIMGAELKQLFTHASLDKTFNIDDPSAGSAQP